MNPERATELDRFGHVPPSPRAAERKRAWALLGVGALVAGLVAQSAPAQEMTPDTRTSVKHASLMVFMALSKSEKGDTPLGSGSGYFLNSTGLAMTNNHVVDPTHGKTDREKQAFHYQQGRLTWTVVTDAGTDDEKTWEADVIYQNESADQAILQVQDEDGNKLDSPDYLRLLPESRLHLRKKVWSLGFPGGDSQRTARDKHPEVSITVGHIIDLPRTPAGRVRRVYTDGVVRRGNSGGPTVDVDGFLVGTVTLMTKPEGREDTGGANYAALVPAKLTGEMVQNAFRLGKVAYGSDFTPFMELLSNDFGRLDIAEFKRLTTRDVLFYDGGDRIYGQVATDKIVWDSPIGLLEFPTTAVAYVMNTDEGSSLFLEGANRISASEVGSTFQFTADGGSETEQDFDDLHVVGFRTEDRSLKQVRGRVMILDTDVAHLVLSEVQGTLKFESRAGTIEIPFDEIERIEWRADDDEQVVVLDDGRRLSGSFTDDTVRGTIAATGTIIDFHLAEVERGTVEVRYHGVEGLAGLDLIGVLDGADRQVKRVAKKLEAGDIEIARKRLTPLLDSAEFKRMPDVKREQIVLLDGVTLLREGKYTEAKKTLRKSRRADNGNIKAYANACLSVLDRYAEEFEGKPLKDPMVVADAGTVLGEELIQQVRDFLKNSRSWEGEHRGEYTKGLNGVKRYEERMRVAAIFLGTVADDEMIRLWQLAADLCMREIERIDREIEEKQEDQGRGGRRRAGGSRRGGNRAGGRGQREIEELQELREKAIEKYREYRTILQEYGFRIEDPDIQIEREKSGSDDEEDPDYDGP